MTGEGEERRRVISGQLSVISQEFGSPVVKGSGDRVSRVRKGKVKNA
jgi:hypothetical protein